MAVDLTELVLEQATVDELNAAAELGRQFGAARYCQDKRLRQAWDVAFEVQMANGMAAGTRRMLSTPTTQHKLKRGVVPSFGLTLYHHLMRSTLFRDGKRLVVNSCPSAGDCTRLCVINNNWGRMDSVRLGWRWRTDLLARHPVEFMLLLAWNIERARRGYERILFRPNINSDVEWERIAPALVDGTLWGELVGFYGYTKHTSILDTDGWLTPCYRVAYSWNEKSPAVEAAVLQHITNGGSVAVVTDRIYRPNSYLEPIKQWHDTIRVVDGDVSDEWVYESSVIGDLAFKPDTNEIREWGMRSDFVVKVYHPEESCLTTTN